jgi:hypothetical protein
MDLDNLRRPHRPLFKVNAAADHMSAAASG